MILPRGITRFNVPKGHPGPDRRGFLGDCWQAAVGLRGRVDDQLQVADWVCVNFDAWRVVLPGGEVTALLNHVHPWIGFCRPREPGSLQLDFVEPGRLGAALADVGRYRVLTQAELLSPMTELMAGELRKGERTQLKYWGKLAGRGKLRVGDVVFNFWD